MDSEETRDADDTPSRPVSSLRSHFERISTVESRSLPTQSQKTSFSGNEIDQSISRGASPRVLTDRAPPAPYVRAPSKEVATSSSKTLTAYGSSRSYNAGISNSLSASRSNPGLTVHDTSGTDGSQKGNPRLKPDQGNVISGARVPPPINRADKPKLLLGPLPTRMCGNLRPSSSAVDERVSPFSTPPSSDDSSVSRDVHGLHAASKKETERLLATIGQDEPFTAIPTTASRATGTVPVIPAGTMGMSQKALLSRDEKSSLSLQQGATIMAKTMASCETLPNTSPRHNGRPISQEFPQSLRPPPLPPKRPGQDPGPAMTRNKFVTQSGNRGNDVDYQSRFEVETPSSSTKSVSESFPDISCVNRRPPISTAGARTLEIGEDLKCLELCGRYVCTMSHIVRIWDVTTGAMIFSISQTEREVRPSAIAFKPTKSASEESSRIWIGSNSGDLQEVDIASQRVVDARSGVHERRELVKIHRHQNSMWTIDDGGKLCVWRGDSLGHLSLQSTPASHRAHKGHTCSLIVQDSLWFASGREIRVFKPEAGDSTAFTVLENPLCQPSLGIVTSGTVIGNQLDRVYFGHSDGKVSVYSTLDYTCLRTVTINAYKITALVGVGSFLWVAFSVGSLCVYETNAWPWKTKKAWQGHQGQAALGMSIDRSSLWRTGTLRLASHGSDGTVRVWDGSLRNDWLESFMSTKQPGFCTYTDVTALVFTWNAGATTPGHLRYEEKGKAFFPSIIEHSLFPDILVFGFQELVDLEDKKLTAKSLFKGNKKREPVEHEHMSHQYRAWRDYLVHCVEDSSSSRDPYHLLQTANMMGLFSCVFVKAPLRHRVRNVNTGELKRGMGGLHGNKGALVLRFFLDDSALCLVNCHLAAGQTQTSHRNNDITAILDSDYFPGNRTVNPRESMFAFGGDGSRILDHDVCILNGDLNYRIDTMGRDTVIKAVKTGNLKKLLERDQLQVAQRRHPTFSLRAFQESQITFAPTYKYDIESDTYDTSEKRRAPAWCDRVLYRGGGVVTQIEYRRHELRNSDHRPVSGRFVIRVKSVQQSKQASIWADAEDSFKLVMAELSTESKILYLRDTLGVPLDEARRLV